MNEDNDRERQAYEDGREAGWNGKPDSIPYYEDLNLDALWEEGYSEGKQERDKVEADERKRYEEDQRRALRH